MRITLLEQVSSKSNILLNLRPDAELVRYQNGQKNIRFDSRVGFVKRKLPPLYLLDAYILRYNFAKNLKLSLGVFEHLSNFKIAYRPDLLFGLIVLFPRSFSEQKLHGKNQRTGWTNTEMKRNKEKTII